MNSTYTTRCANDTAIIEMNKRSKNCDSLCWLCECCTNSDAHHCEKSEKGEAVPGWSANKVESEDGSAWQVSECPKFYIDYSRPQEKDVVFAVVNRWCITANGTQVSYRHFNRDPQKWVDRYNKEHPELPLALYLDEEEEGSFEGSEE